MRKRLLLLTPILIVDLTTDLGLFRAAVPSGASTGIHEALELRDNDKKNYHGKDVSKAIDNVNKIIVPELLKQSFEATQQKEIDDFMLKLDGTPNKSKLGANAILGVSIAVCKAGAAKKGVPLYRHIADLAGVPDVILPVPAFNVINGGAATFTEAMKMGSEVYHHLKNVIKGKFGLDATAVGDEGGFAPNILNNKDGLDLIKDAIEKAGYTGKIEIGMDVAASEFFR
ncbi:Enolase [Blattella germanica]|nr:Enolase [Blattella germanica]